MPRLSDYSPYAGPNLPKEPWPTDDDLLLCAGAILRNAGDPRMHPEKRYAEIMEVLRKVRLETARACAELSENNGHKHTIGRLYGFAGLPFEPCPACGQTADHHGICGCAICRNCGHKKLEHACPEPGRCCTVGSPLALPVVCHGSKECTCRDFKV